MAIIKLASVPKIDNDGFWRANLSVTETIKTLSNNTNISKRVLIVDTYDVECFELIFEGETIDSKKITIKTDIFGANINPIPTGEARIGNKKILLYNKFTTVLIQLGILNKIELDKAKKDITVLNVHDIASQFTAIKQMSIQIKLQKNGQGSYEPNLLSLAVTAPNFL